MPTAYSYLRFSSPQQKEGDSIRRQTEATEKWCVRNEVRLGTLKFRDDGKSGFTGAHLENPDLMGLAGFLHEVKRPGSRIKPDDYLVIENLDRLTRQHIRKAQTLVNEILDAKIHIVTTSPEYVYRHDSDNLNDTIIMVVELMRSHRESAQKSSRIKDAWAEKRKRLNTGQTLTRKVPAWVRVNDAGRRVLIQPVADTIRKLFRYAQEGHGVYEIARLMNEAGLTTPTGKHWSESTVYHYLRTRTVTGEYTPRLGRKVRGVKERQAAGKTIKDYYPELITPAQFQLVQTLIHGRAKKDNTGKVRPSQGHKGRGLATNLFAGRMFVWDTQYTYVVRQGGKGKKRLDPLGIGTAVSISYGHFERVMLHTLRELKLEDVLPPDGQAATSVVEAIKDQLVTIKAKIAEFQEAARIRPAGAVLSVLLGMEDERERLEGELRSAMLAAESYRPEVLNETHQLIDQLGTPGVRPRLRMAISRLVDRIDVKAIRQGHGQATFLARIRLATGLSRFVVASYSGRKLTAEVGLDGDEKGNIIFGSHEGVPPYTSLLPELRDTEDYPEPEPKPVPAGVCK